MDKLQIKVSNIIKNNMLYSFKVNKRTKVINFYIIDNSFSNFLEYRNRYFA